MWRKRVGVEPTPESAKDTGHGFEDHEDHRTPFASANSIADAMMVRDERPGSPTRSGKLQAAPTKSLVGQERWEAMTAACWVRIKAATRSYSAGLVQTS